MYNLNHINFPSFIESQSYAYESQSYNVMSRSNQPSARQQMLKEGIDNESYSDNLLDYSQSTFILYSTSPYS